MSIPPKKPNASAITTEARESPAKTGQPAGETGSAVPAETTRPPWHVFPPRWIGSGHAIMSESMLRWVDANKHKLPSQLATSHSSSSLIAAASRLSKSLQQLDRFMQPASDKEILQTLHGLGETFQVEVPDQMGLEIYVTALRTIPRPAFVRAREALVLSHKWPRLPFPAEFKDAAKEESDRLEQARMVLATLRRRCLVASDILHECSK